MKKTRMTAMIGILCLLMAAPVFGAGGFGNRAGGNGLGDGTGPMALPLEGEPFTVTGVITELGGRGMGMQIDTGVDVVTVYGIGPIRFWENLGIAHPAVGETITANGLVVVFSDGTAKNIATNVVLTDGGVVELRDAETGAPLWRNPGGKGPRGAYPCDLAPEADAAL